jgi:4,5-DOPA dioxygenase extradiol
MVAFAPDKNTRMTTRMPAIFFGHGNPMNTLRHNAYTAGWAAIGAAMPRPHAVLSISAHWYIAETMVTAMANPPTVHDFGGFPPRLYEFQYPAGGDPELARRIRELLAPVNVGLDQQWGLDHGTWSVLAHVFPRADIPVLQLSIDATKPALFHYEIGKRLAPLRDEGVLVVGSGNIVHNLSAYRWREPDRAPYDWAARFEQHIRESLLAGNDASVIAYENFEPDAQLSVPTPDHYLPLLYVAGARQSGERVSFPVEGFDGGSMSMLAVQIV